MAREPLSSQSPLPLKSSSAPTTPRWDFAKNIFHIQPLHASGGTYTGTIFINHPQETQTPAIEAAAQCA